MPQHDYSIDDQGGLSFLADLDGVLEAIVTNNEGTTAPSPTFPHMWWPDALSGIVKQRNAANTAWINRFAFDATLLSAGNNLSELTDKPAAFSAIKQPASTTTTGVVEKATPTEMTNGTADKYPDAATIKSYVDAKAIISPVSRVRQTVLSGPVNSNGRASFIIDGGGLSVDSSGLTSTSLMLSYSDGFDSIIGEKNLIVEVDSDVSWSSLTDDATNYLYLDYASETITAGNTTLAPVYSYAKPSSPATGQYWYPVDHRSRGEYWNGSAWVPVLRMFVGQATTSSGSVVEAISYAYQGKAETAEVTIWGASTVISGNHNIGAPSQAEILFRCISATSVDIAYEVDDTISTPWSYQGSSLGGATSVRTGRLSATARAGSTGGFYVGGSNVAAIPPSNFNVFFRVERAF